MPLRSAHAPNTSAKTTVNAITYQYALSVATASASSSSSSNAIGTMMTPTRYPRNAAPRPKHSTCHCPDPGADSTASLAATHGRSAYLAEETQRGVVDPGARAVAIAFAAVASA